MMTVFYVYIVYLFQATVTIPTNDRGGPETYLEAQIILNSFLNNVASSLAYEDLQAR